MKNKTIPFMLLTIVLVFAASCSKPTDDQKADEAISKLSLKQKLDLLGGTGFATKPIDSLGIPEIKMTDGPLGPLDSVLLLPRILNCLRCDCFKVQVVV